jgi:molybdopterin-guanine dinucleotide biosynthesis protein A
MIELGAVVLMGGRASRLGGIVKGDLGIDGRTLLERAVDAAAPAGEIVVVGEAGRSRLPAAVLVVREDPPFGGPAAAVAAGVRALGSDASAVLLLAGDLPFAADAVPGLLAEFGVVAGRMRGAGDARGEGPGIEGAERGARDAADGVRAVDAEGRAQHLLCVVRRHPLERAIAELEARGPLEGSSMRSLLTPLRFVDLGVPGTATMDVDTWADAESVGATGATRGETP